MKRGAGLVALLPLLSTQAWAHGGGPTWTESATTWSTEPTIVAPLIFSGWWYGVGWIRLHARTSSARRWRELLWFISGWLALALALISPIHPLGSVLFSVHMVQHELLMVIAAPLLVLGRTELYCLCALPPRLGSRTTKRLRASGVARVWRKVNEPLVAWFAHAAALWIWHVPRWFEAALTSSLLHTFQHISFFGTAILFWQAVFRSPRRRAAYGLSVLYLFTTALHTGALGALLTFARMAWYPAYEAPAARASLSAIEDQQLGGLIMWIPASFVYVAAGLTLFAAWLRESDLSAHGNRLAGARPIATPQGP